MRVLALRNSLLLAFTLLRVAVLGLGLTAGGRVPHRDAKQVTRGPEGEVGPMCSPDGQWLAFEYFGSGKYSATPRIRIAPRNRIHTSARFLVGESRYNGDMSWSPDSHWIAVQMDFPVDGQNGPKTDNTQIAKVNIYTRHVQTLTNFAANTTLDPTTAWLKTGWIVFAGIDESIYAIPVRGGGIRKLSELPVDHCPGGMNTLGASPDGERIALDMSDFDKECDALWIFDTRTGEVDRIATEIHPVSPFWLNAETILFAGEDDKEEPIGIYRIALRTGRVERLLAGPYLTPFVCDGGKTLYFSFRSRAQGVSDSWRPFHGFHIWKMPMPSLPE